MNSPVAYSLTGAVGVIRIDYPPVNALSQAVRQGIVEAIDMAEGDASEVVVLLCAGRTFMAGADITEFGKPPLDPWLPEVVDRVEASAKPVVAAIHGTALGGGFEVAMGCHYRIALASARVGLPEVKLGLLPGAGGTQRAPRLAGVRTAIDMMTSGSPLQAGAALDAGLLDRVVDDDLEAAALDYAREIAAGGGQVRRTSQLPVETVDPGVFAEYRASLERKAHGLLAPQKIVDCVEAATTLPFPEGSKVEREAFDACMASPQSAGLRHIFFAERQAAKVDDLPKETPLREVRKVGIIGAGTMGSGIAMNFANAGLDVSLLEVNDDALGRGLETIARNYDGGVSRGKMSEAEAVERRNRIVGTTDYGALADADLVVEAVFENLGLKQDIFQKLDEVCKPGAILATNTSYQDVNRIAASTARPQDVIGLHFFSPAHIMKLLEIVRADATADDVLATCLKLAKAIRKIPVVARVCYGFIGNRMLKYYGREAQLCLIEGASPDSIDTAVQQWGMAMGPMRVFDLAGLDVGYKAREGLSDEEKGDPRAYAVADRLVDMGRLGQKSGAGFYTYDPESRAYHVDAAASEVFTTVAAEHGVVRRDVDASEIVDRLIFALINEGLKIVDEGIAQRPSDIDVVWVYGYGFPAHRGGPMHYADVVGLPVVLERVQEFRQRFGDETWTPAALLERLVADGKRLSDWRR